MPELIARVLEAHRAQPGRTWYATEVLAPGWKAAELTELNQTYSRLAAWGLVETPFQIVMPMPAFATVAWRATADRSPLSKFMVLEDDVADALRPLVDCDDPDLFRFAVSIMQRCVLENTRPPEGALKRRWQQPGGAYRGQWIWDVPFDVDLMSVFPDHRDTIREIFENYWDFQEGWDSGHPDYARGMIPGTLKPEPMKWADYFPAQSQIPTLAWGVERVYLRNRDLELVRRAIRPLEAFHDWWWRERDVRDRGLIHVGAYVGGMRQARYENLDHEATMDDMSVTPHPTRKGATLAQGCYGDTYLSAMTTYLILAEDSLARLADLAGEPATAARRRARRDRSIAAMREHMWDEEWGMFLSVKRDTLEKVRIPTIGAWLPLHASVPTPAMAERMAAVLSGPDWQTNVPIATVARSDPHWTEPSCCYVRGDVWPPLNYQVCDGLVRYGFRDLAASICDKTIANARRRGVAEFYHCDTGEPMGVPYLNMSATMLTMMLDGLTREHRLTLRAPRVVDRQPPAPAAVHA